MLWPLPPETPPRGNQWASLPSLCLIASKMCLVHETAEYMVPLCSNQATME